MDWGPVIGWTALVVAIFLGNLLASEFSRWINGRNRRKGDR